MPWDEAGRLARVLRADPTSATAAALEGWDHPISREALILMDLFDLEHRVNSTRKPKPHPMRPWKAKTVQRMGRTGGRSRDQIDAILAAARRGELAA